MLWEQLPTLTRRSFLAYLDKQVPGQALARAGEPRVDGDDVLIPFYDRRSGTRYTARVRPDGSVTA